MPAGAHLRRAAACDKDEWGREMLPRIPQDRHAACAEVPEDARDVWPYRHGSAWPGCQHCRKLRGVLGCGPRGRGTELQDCGWAAVHSAGLGVVGVKDIGAEEAATASVPCR